MNYDLAKKLKDAGFPQLEMPLFDSEGYWYRTEEEILNWVHTPTLSELVEACGATFRSLEKYSNTENGQLVYYWSAYAVDVTGRNGATKKGISPEEAVANLWLELNKNGNS